VYCQYFNHNIKPWELIDMFKKTMLLSASCLTFVTLSAPQEGSATPVFARQTSQSCAACHFQRFPLLNAYGRTFKAKGYTQVGKQGTIDDTNLSLPATLNAGVVSKFRYQKTNGTADTEVNSGQFQIPDEAFLSLGGRVAKNIGFQAEIGLLKTPLDVSVDPLTGEGSASKGEVGLNGIKIPFVFPANDFTFSAIPFYTDAQGPAFGFELLNTGALRFSRAFEHRGETSSQQYLSTDGKTTGLALVAFHKYGYVSYTPYLRDDASTFSSGKYLSYIRGVVTPEKVGEWDLAAGFQIWTGNSQTGTKADPIRNHADAWSVDAQAQGKVSNLPLGIYATYGTAEKSSATVANAYNSSLLDSKNAFTVAAELGIIPSKLSIGAGYRHANKGTSSSDTENAVTLGANYQIARNMVFQVNHSFYSGDLTTDAAGDQKTTVMLYSAF
jgi:hypothetical protein